MLSPRAKISLSVIAVCSVSIRTLLAIEAGLKSMPAGLSEALNFDSLSLLAMFDAKQEPRHRMLSVYSSFSLHGAMLISVRNFISYLFGYKDR